MNDDEVQIAAEEFAFVLFASALPGVQDAMLDRMLIEVHIEWEKRNPGEGHWGLKEEPNTDA